MRKVIKIAFVVGIALLCMCIYNDSTPSEAVEEVSNYIGDISNKMEGGYDRQYNSILNVIFIYRYGRWYTYR